MQRAVELISRVQKSSWLIPADALPSVSLQVLLSLLFHCLFYANIPSNQSRQAKIPPLHTFLHSQVPSTLMNKLEWRVTWLTDAFYPDFRSQRHFLILKSCAKYTLHTPPSLTAPTILYQNDLLVFCLSYPALMWQTCFVNICIPRSYSSVGLE